MAGETITGSVDYGAIRAAAMKNIEAGKYDAGHVKILGIGIPKGPFADKDKAAAYDRMQKDVDDALELYRKARAMMNGLDQGQT